MRASPPGPKGDPIFGNSRQYARDPFSFMDGVAAAYPNEDVVHLELGPLDTYMLQHPRDVERVLVSEWSRYEKPKLDDAITDLLGDGLLLGDGEGWQRQRDLANPAFSGRRVGTMADSIAAHAEALVDGWEAGEVVNVQLEMAAVTVRIIVNAMLGVDPTDEQLRVVQENLEPLGARFEPDPIRFAIPEWAPTRENREFRAAVERLETVIDEFVEARRGTQYDPAADPGETGGDEPMDFLSILLRAQDRGEQTDRQLRDEMMTMLLAGHDTTALALTYTFYLLSEHPDVQARVYAELDEVVGDEPPSMRDVGRMAYTDRVLREAMRLYPPVYTMFREPLVDVKLGGYRVPEGSTVMLPQWVIHRSPRYWDEPTTFDPDRFLPERARDRPRFAYFPFGGGPRHCIGKQLSLLEAKLILGAVSREYRPVYEGEGGSLDLRGSLTMHPSEPVTMRLEPRA